MSASTVWTAIGSAMAGLAAGVVTGIFVGKAIRQRRCNAEIDSVKEAYQKYFRQEIEKEKAKTKPQPELEDTKPKDIPENKKPATNEERIPYQVLTRDTAIDIANDYDIEIEDIPVTEQGHSIYIPDEILTKKLGMEPNDISELLNTTDEHLFIKNNIDGKLYEVYIPGPF